MSGVPFTARVRLLARALKYRHRQDVDEIRFVRGHVRRGGTVLDIGAHKGAYTYWLRRAVGPAGLVVAFEPQAVLARELERLFAGTPNVRVEHAAVSSRPGFSTLEIGGDGPSPGARIGPGAGEAGPKTIPVRLTTVDDYAAGRGLATIDFIKCDVEGHERDVFEGAARVLATRRPTLLFECEARHEPRGGVEGVFAFLAGLGYRGFFFDASVRRPVAEFAPARHQRVGGTPYVNNFVFVAED